MEVCFLMVEKAPFGVCNDCRIRLRDLFVQSLVIYMYWHRLWDSECVRLNSGFLLTEYCRSVTIVTNPETDFLNHKKTTLP